MRYFSTFPILQNQTIHMLGIWSLSNFKIAYYTNWKKYTQSTQSVPTEIVNEKFVWKVEAQLSALKHSVSCDISAIYKRPNNF